jgi:predicted MFS family arabinose efflux permease
VITPPQLRLFALAAGVAVGNITIAQPLLDELAGAFSISSGNAGLLVTVTQVGYALGLLFLVPLGDMVDRRRLLVVQAQLSAVALVAIAAAPSTPVLLAGMAALGVLAVMTQVLVAFAASLAHARDRGRVIGVVTGGVVVGILTARTLSGIVSDVWGWRAVYGVAAVVTSVVGWRLKRLLPAGDGGQASVPYRRLVASMPTLLRQDPVLRSRAALAALIFATLNVLWSSLALALSSAPLSLSNGAIGLFGLVGLAGAAAAVRAGRLADAGLAHVTTGVALAAMALAWLPIALLEQSLGLLVLGLVLLDGTVQAVHVTSQSMIADALPNARSRAVAAYMVFYSIGTAGGSIASTATYAWAGWLGVSILGASLSMVGFAVWLTTLRRRAVRSRWSSPLPPYAPQLRPATPTVSNGLDRTSAVETLDNGLTPADRARAGAGPGCGQRPRRHSLARAERTSRRAARRAGRRAARTPARAPRAKVTASDPVGMAKVVKPSPASADTSPQARNTPRPRPPTVPNSATVMASLRTIAPVWPRVWPTARSRPSSRVRSWIDSDSVLAIPMSAITIARISSA